jgi:hypothetical protein
MEKKLAMDEFDNKLAQYIRATGVSSIDVDGIDWYEYSGFMVPAYLPHCMPDISLSNAKRACKLTGRPFARWVSGFEESLEISEWWHVIREGKYNLSDCSSNTRSKISRGKKKLISRLLVPEEVMAQGYDVCKRAVERFDDDVFLPSRDFFEARVQASIKIPGVMEYCGVFSDGRLVALSENLIQCGAVFWETIWYDPAYLGSYSSYVLTDFMLNHYLNERNFLYVSDGSRSIYHDTSVQDFFIQKFGFEKKFLELHVYYRTLVGIIVHLTYPIISPLLRLKVSFRWRYFKKIWGLMRQEKIRRACGL